MSKIKRKLFFISLILLTLGFLSYTLVDEKRKEETLVGAISEILNAYHYSPEQLDDKFSESFYNLYLSRLDFNKMYLIKSDIDMLETYKLKLDDEIQQRNFNFLNLSAEIIQSRTFETKDYYKKILSEPFDSKVDEFFELDEKKRQFAKDKNELYDIWRKTLKYQVLDKVVDLQNEQLEAKKKNDTLTLKTFEILEAKARKYVLNKYDNRYSRIDKVNRQDRLSLYLNAFASCFDPHTGYFPPDDKKDFDIAISGKLEGIGATLSEKDEYIKVVRIVPGSASWRQGELDAEDIILKVGQGSEEPVDIVGMRLDEAVQLIRGPKGSEVVLTVKKVDGTIKKISIIRDVVILEETFAKSTIITDSIQNKRIGYIYLPKFYVDFENAQGRRCSVDIKKELDKLKKQNVQGIIFDLRDNGGGSLGDVVEIGGYFIEQGPIVQVKSKIMDSKVKDDRNPAIDYDGPLIIMVNTFSASASEILAAAMQDYQRAVIVGTNSTYGKGTVQQFVDIDQYLPSQFQDIKPLGALKVTIQKFYRINGGATQLRGVVPDIILPDEYAYLEIGEKELDNPLEWDQIASVDYKKWKSSYQIEDLKKKYEKRLQKDTISALIDESAKWLKIQREKTLVSLNLDQMIKENGLTEQKSKRYNSLDKIKTGLKVNHYELKKVTDSKLDSINVSVQKEWFTELEKDYQLYQSYLIMSDMLK